MCIHSCNILRNRLAHASRLLAGAASGTAGTEAPGLLPAAGTPATATVVLQTFLRASETDLRQASPGAGTTSLFCAASSLHRFWSSHRCPFSLPPLRARRDVLPQYPGHRELLRGDFRLPLNSSFVRKRGITSTGYRSGR